MQHRVALFGEAEKGHHNQGYVIQDLTKLVELLGEPPTGSQGLFFAVQALLYEREVIYFRVEEEGFSKEDYFAHLPTLKNRQKFDPLHALCLPGVGCREILSAFDPVCKMHQSHIITTEQDFYDYLTNGSF